MIPIFVTAFVASFVASFVSYMLHTRRKKNEKPEDSD